eukprot:12626924-Alexandrium_andersonii.AAC.1
MGHHSKALGLSHGHVPPDASRPHQCSLERRLLARRRAGLDRFARHHGEALERGFGRLPAHAARPQ